VYGIAFGCSAIEERDKIRNLARNDTFRSVVVEHHDAPRDLVRTLNVLNHGSNQTLPGPDRLGGHSS
jgi:hypothetical protein